MRFNSFSTSAVFLLHNLPYPSLSLSLSDVDLTPEPYVFYQNLPPRPPTNAPQQQEAQHQHPIMNVPPVSPPSQPDNDNNNDSNDPSSQITISDILPRLRAVNIFASLTRDIAAIESRLSSQSQNTTLLAPLNSALQALPRKPWEDPPGATRGSDDDEGDDGAGRAAKNLRRFVEAHATVGTDWSEEREEGERGKRRTMGGGEIWWVRDSENEGRRKIMPDGIRVKEVVRDVANGEVWVLEGVINYS